MNENVLKALLKLFSIIAGQNSTGAFGKTEVYNYLNQLLPTEKMVEYYEYYLQLLKENNYDEDNLEKKKKKTSLSSVKVVIICENISKELNAKQRVVVLLRLIEMVYKKEVVTEEEIEFIEVVRSGFNVSENSFHQIVSLVKNETNELKNHENLLIVSNYKPTNVKCKIYTLKDFDNELYFLYLKNESLLLGIYSGNKEILINKNKLSKGNVYIIPQGTAIKISKSETLFFSEIVSKITESDIDNNLNFKAENVIYKFKSGDIGLHTLNFEIESGSLIGIMGGSGAGKSTLLNILNGNYIPNEGTVKLNGMDIHKDKSKLEGVIGFVPQDDLLIEELTVYENLYYNACLCLPKLTKEEREIEIVRTLDELGLLEIKDFKVGNAMNKVISGGQRKRLNISLELIRKPEVLFADEPTSGLSSRDSENVIDLLKEESQKGKIVFVVIHQPSSDIFKLFDKLLILDKGGYPVYFGNPLHCITYFKNAFNHINAAETECETCGSVNPEQIFNIIETKVIDEYGNATKTRKIKPQEWNSLYVSNIENQISNKNNIADKSFKYPKPNKINQFFTFLKRDFAAKLSNKQYLLVNLLEPILLALILSSILRKSTNGQYLFNENSNIPSFLFISVVVAIFMGIMLSAEEIFKDKKILKRESFLNLSFNSYLLSKISVLFLISFIQTTLFVIIGNSIIGIQNMYFSFIVILFLTSAFSVMVGLLISSLFNSIATIYIIIPLVIIPQILLSGLLVKYNELMDGFASETVTPVVGDLMISRWAFEALATEQLLNNKIAKTFYPFEKKISNLQYKKTYWANKMIEYCDSLNKNPNSEVKQTLRNEVEKSIELKELKANIVSSSPDYNKLKQKLKELKEELSNEYKIAVKQKDEKTNQFISQIGGDENYKNYITKHTNKKLIELGKNNNPGNEYTFPFQNHLYPVYDAIYSSPPKEINFRAHYFAPSKNVFGGVISTFIFNNIVMLIFTFGIYLILRTRKI